MHTYVYYVGYIYICVCVCVCMCVYVYVYIYIHIYIGRRNCLNHDGGCRVKYLLIVNTGVR